MAASFPFSATSSCELAGQGWVSDYAVLLLGSLGLRVRRVEGQDDPHPAQLWSACGGMMLTGEAQGAAQMIPWPLASNVVGVSRAIRALVEAQGMSLTGVLPDARTLGERAALAGLKRRGDVTAGGAGRLLETADGALAVNLPREDDWAWISAWLAVDEQVLPGEAGWQALANLLRSRAAGPLLERAHLMGLAVAQAGPLKESPVAWYRMTRIASPPVGASPPPSPLVIDLSSLWAGPLCSHLLQFAGARVVKVESLQRPDGARRGPAAFFDLMNHGKASVALDFSCPQGIARLRALLAQADIVIESSRPRALRQLGIHAEEIIAARPRLTWLSISGHGRDAPEEDWVAYGDDAAVAAGLSGTLHELTGKWLFCGDAIADPLTGWHAALAALAGYYSGGGGLISLALVDVVCHCAQFQSVSQAENVAATLSTQERWRAWQALVTDVASPFARTAAGPARPLGADTASILSELGIPC